MQNESSETSPLHDDRPGHAQAATVAGMQFVAAIAAVGVVAAIALLVFLFRSMGWAAIGPLVLITIVVALTGYIVHTVIRSRSRH